MQLFSEALTINQPQASQLQCSETQRYQCDGFKSASSFYGLLKIMGNDGCPNAKRYCFSVKKHVFFLPFLNINNKVYIMWLTLYKSTLFMCTVTIISTDVNVSQRLPVCVTSLVLV